MKKDDFYGILVLLGAVTAILGGHIFTGIVGIAMMAYGEYKLGLIGNDDEETE